MSISVKCVGFDKKEIAQPWLSGKALQYLTWGRLESFFSPPQLLILKLSHMRDHKQEVNVVLPAKIASSWASTDKSCSCLLHRHFAPSIWETSFIGSYHVYFHSCRRLKWTVCFSILHNFAQHSCSYKLPCSIALLNTSVNISVKLTVSFNDNRGHKEASTAKGLDTRLIRAKLLPWYHP